MATKQTSAAGKANTVFAVFRKCLNWEAGDVLFEDQPLLWFDTLSAAQAVYYASAEQARECVLNEFKIIRRNKSLEFTSGYSWATILFRFPRKHGEDLLAADPVGDLVGGEAPLGEEIRQEFPVVDLRRPVDRAVDAFADER